MLAHDRPLPSASSPRLPPTPCLQWDTLLKSVGVRESHDSGDSTPDQAAAAYAQALHEMKVAVGAESPYVAERLEAAFAGARDALAPIVTTPAAWLREHTAGLHPSSSYATDHHHHHRGFFPFSSSSAPTTPLPHGGGIAAAARAAFHDASDRGLAATLTARDAALAAYNAALERVGLRPEQRTALTRARDGLERATGHLWTTLGYGSPPGVWERVRDYSRHGVEETLAPALARAGAAVGGAYDSGLKHAGLRPHELVDYLHSLPLARSEFNAVLHRVRSALGGGHVAPSTLQHVERALADAAERVARTTAELHASLARLPTALGERVMMGGGAGGRDSGGFAQAHLAELVRASGRAVGLRKGGGKGGGGEQPVVATLASPFPPAPSLLSPPPTPPLAGSRDLRRRH